MEVKDKYLRWFIENQKQLVALYEDMYIVVRDGSVIATFEEGLKARQWAASKFPDGDYRCMHCIAGERAYTTYSYGVQSMIPSPSGHDNQESPRYTITTLHKQMENKKPWWRKLIGLRH